MSLFDKLKPNTKAPVGKVEACKRCGHPDAEYQTANFQLCPRCDAKPTKVKGHLPGLDEILKAPYPDRPLVDAFINLDWDEDDDTKPQWQQLYMPEPASAWYRCSRCASQWKCGVDDVANGQRCSCGGPLTLMTSAP